jgi:NTP pyrophosphatase (non-canonical NTP hydrolase)
MQERTKKMIDLNSIAIESLEIAEKRDLKTDTVSTLKHCAGEVVEAMDAYTHSLYNKNLREEFAMELADVIMCILTISGHLSIDIEKAIEDCLKKNKAREIHNDKD